MYPLVSVSIVNWNGLRHIKKCLQSVYAQDYKGPIEIIVVDNASQDQSLEFIQDNFKDVIIIKNKENKGFAYAHNQAIRISKGEFNLFLNFDIFLEPMFISAMVETISKDALIGVVSGKLYKQLEGQKSTVLDSTGIMMQWCFMKPRGETEEDVAQYDTPEHRTIFGVCGAAAFCRKIALEDIKSGDEYFDEDFVNYVEDVDLSWRMQLRGWFCVYTPQAIAYHERGVTRKNNNKMLRSYLVFGFRNRYCSMFKNLTWHTIRANKIEIVGREISFLVTRIKEIPYSVKLDALIRAVLLLVKMIPKRMFIQRNRLADEEYMAVFFQYNKEAFRKEIRERCRMLSTEVGEKRRKKYFSRGN